jgi:CHU_C Type IX secretion signal domain
LNQNRYFGKDVTALLEVLILNLLYFYFKLSLQIRLMLFQDLPTKRIALFYAAILSAVVGLCQAPFDRTGQVFLASQFNNYVVEMIVNPSNFVPDFVATYPLPNTVVDAIGFRKTDNLIYGINPYNNHLITVGSDGISLDMGALPLDNSLFYLAGDVSPDGKELISIGSNGTPNDVHIARTNLESSSFSTVFVPIINASFMADIAIDPYTGQIYGFDSTNRNMVKIDATTGAITILHQIDNDNDITGLYFDSFGQLHGYGRAVLGIVDGVFDIDKVTGVEKLVATGPSSSQSDAASGPYSVEIKAVFEPDQALPCSEVNVNYTIANGSGEIRSGVDFIHDLPLGFHLTNVLVNPFGVPVDTTSEPGTLRMQNLNLQPGLKTLSFKIEVNDIPKGIYKSQPYLSNLSSSFGLVSISDNATTPGFEDSITLKVNRFDEDSLFFDWLICHGQTLMLDASEYGNSFVWNDGSTSAAYEVAQGGIYSLDIGSSCEQLVVTNEVTSTSCPFTISLFHVFEPDTMFACNNNLLRFIFKNDSGEKRESITLTDTLPAGFSFVEIGNNPFGGNHVSGLAPNIVKIEGMTMGMGTDTLDILVYVGDVPPGNYRNQGILGGLPQSMGPIRFSDDPTTLFVDRSTLHILGTLDDTLYLDTIICWNDDLLLDASIYGKNFIWEDGSTGPTFTVKQPGIYHVTLFDGCEPADIYWQVNAADSITVDVLDVVAIHQGEEMELAPMIYNEGGSLLISWTDPIGNSLSCLDCWNPVAMPLKNTTYSVRVFNSVCSDTAMVEFQVDEARRVYAPNVFSPNGDGINDYFYLQSPDFGIIHSLEVKGRWSNQMFYSNASKFNVETSGWDGLSKDKGAIPGVYIWEAVIEFVDGKKEILSGEVSVIR